LGDVVVTFGGMPVKGAVQFARLVEEASPMRTTTVSLRRDTRTLEASVTVLPSGDCSLKGANRLDIMILTLNAQLGGYFGVRHGLLVTSVGPDRTGAAAGLRVGDILVGVNGRVVDSKDDLDDAINADSGHADLDVVRAHRPLSLHALWEPPPQSRPHGTRFIEELAVCAADSEDGALVTASLAGGDGFRVGDVVTRAGNTSVQSAAHLQRLMNESSDGISIVLLIARASGPVLLDVVPRRTAKSIRIQEFAVAVEDRDGRPVVVSVDEDREGWKAGFRVGDVISAIDGQTVQNSAHLSRLVAESPGGYAVEVATIRAGATSIRRLVPGPSESPIDCQRHSSVVCGMLDSLAGMPPEHWWEYGVEATDAPAQLRSFLGARTGVLITRVRGDSWGSSAGLRVADIVVGVNYRPVRDAEELFEAIRSTKGAAAVDLVRDHHSLELEAHRAR
jgi:S1-C subfamily serine protease